MNGSQAQVVRAPADNTMLKRMSGELMGEVIGALAVIALTIAGLAGAGAAVLASIATIVLGAALLLEGGVFAGTLSIERGEWTSTGFLGGATGIVLGILALLGVVPGTLVAAATIVFGAALLFGHLTEGYFGGRVLVGIGAIVLGILAVVGLSQLTLVLIALLSLGVMELMAGLESGAKTASLHAKGTV